MQKMNEKYIARLEREKKEKEALAAKAEGREIDQEEETKDEIEIVEDDDWFPYKLKEDEDVKKLKDTEKAMQKFEFLVRVEKEYGERSLSLNKVYEYILDDFHVTRQIMKDRKEQTFMKVTAKIKKIVSFIGIYTSAEEIDTLDRKIKFYKKKLAIVI